MGSQFLWIAYKLSRGILICLKTPGCSDSPTLFRLSMVVVFKFSFDRTGIEGLLSRLHVDLLRCVGNVMLFNFSFTAFVDSLFNSFSTYLENNNF